MMLAVQSIISVAIVPLIAFAIEPANPQSFCDRFLAEKDTQACIAKTQKEEVDWYAASICQMQKEDSAFWSCWDSIKGKSFNPTALKKCAKEDSSDLERQSCISASDKARKPASSDKDLFQPLKIHKQK